jgi:IS5 family transposase
MEAKRHDLNLKRHIHHKGKRGKPLTQQAKGGTLVRSIGLVWANAKIGMKNLAYNMRHLCQLRRINPNPA